MLKSLWLVHNCSDYYVSIITTVLLTLIDGLSFSFLKHPCRKTHHGHIPVKIHQGQRVKEWLERRMKNHFHTWIGSSESRPYSLKVFGMCWRRLYRVLDSCIVNTRSSPKMYLLMEITSQHLFPSRGAYLFLGQVLVILFCAFAIFIVLSK